MKELFLLRHAKTRKAEPGTQDRARELARIGQEAATQIGEALQDDNRTPEIIISSDAVRTVQTSELVEDAMDLSGLIKTSSLLYSAGVEEVLELLAGRQESRIMVVGHNPCMEELVEHLTGEVLHMRPGFCLWLRFDMDVWVDLYDRPEVVSHKLYKPRSEDE